MAAESRTKTYTQGDQTNSIGMTKFGKIVYQWRPATRNAVDQFAEKNLESTLPTKSNSLKFTNIGSTAAQVDTTYNSNLNTTMQVEKVVPMTQTNGDNARALTPDDTEKKLTEKMQTDAGDTTWLPQMDGIDVVLPSCSQTTNKSRSSAAMWTTDDKVRKADEMLKTEEYINHVLKGRRLPIFQEICPDDKED